jgi:hypothetical protein
VAVGRTSRATAVQAHRGTEGSNPFPSSGESANFQFLARCDCDGETRFIALAYGKFESSSLQRRVQCELADLELDSNLRFRARAVSVLPLRDQMLASSSSSGEPGESPFSRPGHFREAADNYDCAGRGQPAPHTPSPGRRMAISRRGSYAKTTPRTSTSPTPIARPRRGEGAAAT